MWATPNEATMSVVGLKSYNQYLFDDMVIPDGVDRTVLTNNIIYDCAELEVIYPDPYFMQFAIGEWSKKELPIWQKIHEMETAEYNPIENYDRYDSEIENTGRQKDGTRGDVTKRDVKETTSGDRSSTKADTINSTNDAQSATVQGSIDSNRVAGFNSETLVTNNQTTSNNTSNTSTDSKGASVQNTTETDTDSATRENTENVVNTGTNTENENENRVKQLHSHGNIGVVTVAAMMKELVGVLPEVNTINYIVESFKKRFCLLVY